MKSQELRSSFVDFFVSQGHKLVAPASLIPDEMSTTLFTIAGMEQFVPVFLGEIPAPAPRVVTVQPCLRVAGAKSDIENVGRTGRHGTFLEMLGNFSFGDYYKREAIAFAWEYVTRVLKLDKERLYVTVHLSDDEAQEIWEREIGVSSDRITRWDEDNFWTMGPTGPCGPCSEIFYDSGPQYASGPNDTGPNKGDRYLEIWNVVFQQYNRGADGKLTDLPRKAIDTGAGLERMLAVANGKVSMYETDLFIDLIAAQPSVENKGLHPQEQTERRRIIADHARAVTFLIAEGVYPSNTDRGYVLRFLIRRAIRNGRILGYPREFMPQLASAVVDSLGSGYPELRKRLADVQTTLSREEQNFIRTLDRGNALLEGLVDDAIADCTRMITGHDAFTLHDTYGFPVELTREIAMERGVAIDVPGFDEAMQEQRARARADAAEKRAVVNVTDLPSVVSIFHGYAGLEMDGEIVMIMRDGQPVDELIAGESAQIFLDHTSFYAEKGGQIGDRGALTGGEATFDVTDTQFVGEAIAHHGTLRSGILRRGERVHAAVDPQWREEIRRHHTSAHLLQKALKEILGDEVAQAGSWVGIDRMRFDFRWPGGALTTEQQDEVSHRVNAMIREDHHLVTRELPIEEAKKTGAYWMAGEKYGELVRVVQAGPSVEFCGGTHAHTTGELGMFIILSESSIGSGVRRIESCVSRAAEVFVQNQQHLVETLSERLSSKPDELLDRVGKMQTEIRDLQKSVGELKSRFAAAEAQDAKPEKLPNGRAIFVAELKDYSNDDLRSVVNAVRQRNSDAVIAVTSTSGDRVSMIVSVPETLTTQGLRAGDLMKIAAPHIGGKGGGGPTQAQGGGNNPAGAGAALAELKAAVAANGAAH
jgi:alanyl-tRNA synthetase